MKSTFVLALGAAICVAIPAHAVSLYSQDFEADDSANWTLNSGPSDAAADFFFDYSTVGIPTAPNGTGTRGMKLQANLTDAIFSGVSASPTGLDLAGSYVLSADVWANSVGTFPGGGSGSTNLSTFGVGTSGTVAQWPGGTQDSVWFGATGDGGSSADWRAYSTASPTSYPDADPVYSAPSRNASDPLYAPFGDVAPPDAQAVLFPNQTGNVQVGAFAFAWRHVEILKTADIVRWKVDGVQIAQVDASTVTFGGGNIFFGHADINGTSSSDVNDAALLFTLVDNIHVEQVPEPGAMTLVALASAIGLIRRRK